MYMSRFLTRALAGVLAVTAVFASAYAAGKPQGDRLSVIWDAAMERLNRQNDGWFEHGDYPRAIHCLRFVNAIFPEDYEVATNLGWLLESIEAEGEALAVYVRFRKQNPNDPDSSWPEANFYFKKKAYAKVPPILEPALKSVKTPHSNTFRTLAHSYERMGLLKDSKRVWEALLRFTPQDATAKRNLDRVLAKIASGGSGAKK